MANEVEQRRVKKAALCDSS